VAFIAVTVRMEEPPAAIEAGLALILAVGAGFGVTVMVVVADDFPPAPVVDAV
jgi:hypothetical protein